MSSLYDFTMRTLEGATRSLREYEGKAVLLVNVASRCGYTPQYKGLEALHRELAPKGLVVLGVPCNDFGAQEPGTDEDIKTFCTSRFDVTFPMLSKITVKGATKHALYAWLTSAATPTGEVQWNFEKFLVGRDGAVRGRFNSGVAPESKELRAALEKALAA